MFPVASGAGAAQQSVSCSNDPLHLDNSNGDSGSSGGYMED